MNPESLFELAIIGGGPAGISAGVYAARKKIKTIFITKDFQSQSVVSEDIQNWIGTVSIKGEDFAKNLENHLRAYAKDSVTIKVGEKAIEISESSGNFKIKTNKGEYEAKAILIGTGSQRRKLEVKGADIFDNKGITYCATCDAPLFGEQNVIVVGGGNSAFESALQLSAYAKSIKILSRSKFRADPITVEKAISNPKIKALENIDILEIKGDKFVNGIIFKSKDLKQTFDENVTGVFVEIGSVPSIDFVKNGIIEINHEGKIVVDPKTQRTSKEGIWAAGDTTDGLYHQNNIAAGDAVKALENIFDYLSKR